MQFSIEFTCRECGRDNTVNTDTIQAGVGTLESVVGDGLFNGQIGKLHKLYCHHCGHVSGLLGFHWRYDRTEHAPAHERAEFEE